LPGPHFSRGELQPGVSGVYMCAVEPLTASPGKHLRVCLPRLTIEVACVACRWGVMASSTRAFEKQRPARLAAGCRLVLLAL
jgi:hypothetical protein